ncbi:MAG: DUF4358 domain-containing protein [Oscillospiraceae bacterium]|nr:DUF4358 domain-containing protein [Oscillospiraceae bacterium]
MKKIIAMISAIAMCAAMFTACSSDNSETTETTAADTTIAEVTDETVNDTAVEGDIVISEEDASETEATEETTVETMEEVPADTEEAVDEPAEDEVPSEDGGEVGANPLQTVVDAALAVGEWPAMMEITDEMMLTEYFKLDPANANYRNLMVMQCPMSATMSEIIIIEADDVDAAKADLEARREKAITQDAWYPNDVELAEASIVGTEGDYAYFILAGSAAEAETAIIEALKAL